MAADFRKPIKLSGESRADGLEGFVNGPHRRRKEGSYV